MYSLNIWIVNIFEGTLVVNKADTVASITGGDRQDHHQPGRSNTINVTTS
jgi:hypothetical protein